MLNMIIMMKLLIIAYLFYKLNINKNKSEQNQATLNAKIKDLNAKLENTNYEFEAIKNKSYSLVSSLNIKEKELDSFVEKINLLNSKLDSQRIQNASNLKEAVADARKDSLKRSRSVLRGQASEHLAPYVIKNTNPKDYRFMGNPVDYICFDGLSDVLDGLSDDIKSVRLIDIKTGKSKLNKSQRKIRDAINNKHVSFETINLDEVLSDDTAKKRTQTSSSKKS